MVTQTKRDNTNRLAFTLIELLVVISIMAALTALMLPRLRTLNQDRGIREAARVVGSKFAEASDRARRDGTAAVTLVRNPNMVDVDGVLFGASTVFLSRAVPNFTGDDSTTGSIRAGSILRIPLPLEFDDSAPEENVIRAGDSVRISESSPVTSTVAYEITRTMRSGTDLDLFLTRNSTQPELPVSGTTGISYVIDRQPKILRSSITDLPNGYIVDLRLSGPLETMETNGNSGIAAGNGFRPLFFEKIKPVAENTPLQDSYNRIDVIFDSTGGISSVRTYRGNWDDANTTARGEQLNRVITGPLQLFVSPTELEEGSSPLFSETNLWVTVGNDSGGVNIGYNNPPLTVATGVFGDLVTAARSGPGQSASRSASQ